ncbi:flavin reductase family protein [Amycolatopsis echigonensis]|uniref:Flavin reductase family protein n=1 Tax=Amycolatopsis echigonensis TaxID=2576905 RepID=A0A8E1W682_9PSEU|nr:flavin reductase family protein [Amycolatopsis echigonensis]MBB2504417.1 flavin reductase family protein [Amycolatopsis echigonensis]
MIQLEPLTGDARTLRRAFGCFPSGVTAVCALIDGVPTGMAASSFTSVSMDPPLVSVCVQHTSETWPKLRPRTRLGVSVLAEGHDTECLKLSKKDGDRFAGVSWEATADGAIYLHGATAWLDCSVERELPAGDHAIALLRIHGLRADPDTAPLVFHGSRFRTLAAVD